MKRWELPRSCNGCVHQTSVAAPLMAIRLGIDVGGTNTDAVLLQEDRVIGSAKRSTTANVLVGIHEAVQAVLDSAKLGQDHSF